MLIEPWGDDVLVVRRSPPAGRTLLAVVRLRGAGEVDLRDRSIAQPGADCAWTVEMTTEDSPFPTEPAPPVLAAEHPRIGFARAGAVVFGGAGAR